MFLQDSPFSLKIVLILVVKAQRMTSLIVTPNFFEAVLISSRFRPGEEETFMSPDMDFPCLPLVNGLKSFLARRPLIKIIGMRNIAMALTPHFYKNVASLDLRKKSLLYCSLIARVILVTDIPSQKL